MLRHHQDRVHGCIGVALRLPSPTLRWDHRWEEVDRQRRPSRGNQGKNSPVLAVQSSGAASSKKWSELYRHTSKGQVLVVGSDTGTSSRIHRTKIESSKTKADDAPFCRVSFSFDLTVEKCYLDQNATYITGRPDQNFFAYSQARLCARGKRSRPL